MQTTAAASGTAAAAEHGAEHTSETLMKDHRGTTLHDFELEWNLCSRAYCLTFAALNMLNRSEWILIGRLCRASTEHVSWDLSVECQKRTHVGGAEPFTPAKKTKYPQHTNSGRKRVQTHAMRRPKASTFVSRLSKSAMQRPKASTFVSHAWRQHLYRKRVGAATEHAMRQLL